MPPAPVESLASRAWPQRRALLVAFGSHGDVNPVIGIGRALRARGWAVDLAANAFFRAEIGAAGLGFLEIGTVEQYEAITADRRLTHPRHGFRAVLEGVCELTGPTVALIRREAARGVDVIGATSLVFGAHIARAMLQRDGGAPPVATIHLAPSAIWSVRSPSRFGHAGPPVHLLPRRLRPMAFGLLRRIFDAMLVPRLAPAFRDAGLPRPRAVLRDWWNSPDRVLAMFPEWFAPPAPDWPAQVVCCGFPIYDASAPGSADGGQTRAIDAWVAEGAADARARAAADPVIATFGTANRHAAALLGASLAACRRIGARVVVLSRFDDNVRRLVDSGGADAGAVHIAGYEPLDGLLERLGPRAVLVHHGGIGTSARAMRHGVGQVIVPHGFDQHDNAARIAGLGLAEVVDPWKLSHDRLVERLALAIGRTCPAGTRGRPWPEGAPGFDGCERAADELVRLASAGSTADAV